MSCSAASAVLPVAGNYFHITKVPANQETDFWQFHNVLLNKSLIQGIEFGSLYSEAAQCKHCIKERLSKLPLLPLGKDNGCKNQTSPTELPTFKGRQHLDCRISLPYTRIHTQHLSILGVRL